MIKKVLLIIGFIALSSAVMADQKLRMATLSYGTVNWELDTIQHYGLDKSSGIEMELIKLANLPATRLALLNGGADVAVSGREQDWHNAMFAHTKGAKDATPQIAAANTDAQAMPPAPPTEGEASSA